MESLHFARELIAILLNIITFLIILRAILSWIIPYPKHKLHWLLIRLTEPLLQPIRSILPNFGGLDLSPVILLLLIQLLSSFL